MRSPVPTHRTATALTLLALLALPLVASAQSAASPSTPVANAGVVQPQAGQPGDVTAKQVPHAYVPRSPEELALLDVQNQARVAVAALTAAMAGLNDGPELRALQQRVLDTKRDAEVRFLRVKAQFARNRGDLAAAQAAEDRVEAILHPKAPTAVARPVTGPDKTQR